MSIFIGSNAGETITPDTVSSSVKVIGNPKKPSAGSDIISAGGGNDVVAGGGGSDLALLGAGDDTFIWNGGDGDDAVGGGDGFDTLKFNGANLDEEIEISSLLGAVSVKGSVELQGQRLSSTLLLDSMERIDIAALAGADKINVKNLSGTDIEEVAIDLAGTTGGTTGDGAVDQIVAHGANTRDVVEVFAQGSTVTVEGLSVDVTIKNADANDRLTIKGNGGNDLMSAVDVAAGSMLFTFDGGTGNDVMHGSNGNDTFLGGVGNDFVDGNRGDDVAFLGAGNDTFVWDPGDGSDVVEGGEGRDLMLFNGAGVAENVDIAANGERVRFFRDVANITMDLNDVEKVTFNALGGTDNIVVHDLSGTDVNEVNLSLASPASPITGDGAQDRVTVEGTGNADSIAVASANGTISVAGLAAKVNVSGAEVANDTLVIATGGGNDTIDASGLAADQIRLEVLAGDGNDVITGSAGSDLIVGGRGDDVASMGGGDDTFVWNPGEGSDVVEGGGGFDIMEFNGNGADENIDIRSNGERITFFRDVGNITMDLNDVERSTFNALGGKDTVVVHALNPFEPNEVAVNLAGELSGTTGDGAEDTVIVEDNNEFDIMSISGSLESFYITAGSTFVDVTHAEAHDHVILKASDGDDSVDASTFAPGGIDLTLDGGAGADYMHGSDGVETLIGGDGDDTIDGNRGDDIAFLGSGEDIFVWDPGDGSDIVEGGDGFDALLFNGAGANEPVEISANGDRARFFRQPGNITMDLNDVERITFNALGGTDDITVRDLAGTDVQEVEIDLAGELFGATGDGQADQVRIEGSSEDDRIDVLNFNGALALLGTSAFITIKNGETTDRLVLGGGAGDDSLSASGVPAAAMSVTFDGGAGDDELFGSQNADLFLGGEGDDFVTGNRGDDVAHLGTGNDIFIWNPGDGSDVIEGGEGTDFMGFRGANVAENIDISADGERVKFVRDVANVTMDLNDVERMTFNAFGGVDNIKVGDLSGTDMRDIEISLVANAPNDGAQVSISIQGSAGDDAVDVSTANLKTSIDGLTAHVSITGADAGLDRLQIDAGAGNDAINASGLSANLFQFSILAGAGDDAVIGSNGNDAIDGGSGDDIVSGEAGNDVIDGGDGFDILLGGLGDDLFLNGELIQDFVAGAGSEDRIDLQGLGLSFDWIVDHATDLDGSTLLDLGESQILLAGVTTESLHQDDFLLA